MKNIIILLVVFFLSGNDRTDNNNKQVAKNQNELAVEESKSVKGNDNFNPPFYLRITAIFTGSTLYDESLGCDKVFRLVLYNNEEHVTIVVETIGIGDEGGALRLLKQDKLLEKNLNMPDYSINKVEFVNWLNAKEIELKINDKHIVVDLENLTYRKR